MNLDLQLWLATKGYRGRIVVAILLGLASLGIGIARFVVLGWILGRIFIGVAVGDLLAPLAALLALIILRLALEHLRGRLAHGTAARIQDDLRLQIYDKLVELGPAWIANNRSGGLVLSTVDGVEQLQTFFGQFLPQLAVSLIAPVMIFTVLAWWDIPVAAVLAISALLALVVPVVFKRVGERSTLWRVSAFKAFGEEFLDGLQGLATLKAFGQSHVYAAKLADRARALAEGTMFVVQASLMSRAATDLVIAGGAATAIALGAWRVTTGTMSIEALLIVLMAGTEVFRPLRDLRSLLHRGITGNAAAVEIKNLLNAAPPKPLTESDDRPAIEPAIAFRNVSFAYSDQRGAALTDVSFEVRRGEKIGIVGHSGSGKSTIVRLLLRLADPSAGEIAIDDRDVRSVAADHVRKMISVVQQDTYLFYGSVEDNIRLGQPHASRTDVEQAARAANAHEFIMALPQGYETVIGERGMRLSGGERQRLAVARALLCDAPILVLDEALSSVDAENEDQIQKALDRLSAGRTTIVLAHRLSSIIDADRIIVLEHGRVVGAGSHRELMRRDGPYRRLMAEQAQRDDWIDEASLRDLEEKSGLSVIPSNTTVVASKTVGEEIAARMTTLETLAALFRFILPWRRQLIWTVSAGVGRVYGLIAVSALSALAVALIKGGQWPGHYLFWMAVAVPVAAFLQWNESWRSHDMAYRLLAEMRVELFRQLEKLAPAYLLKRRSGDMVALATQDVETIEYFFAHMVAPSMVALLVPASVIVALMVLAWPAALVLLPFLVYAACAPFFGRRRIDALGAKAREGLGQLNAFVLDTVQGMAELVAFRAVGRRRDMFGSLINAYQTARIGLQTDLSLQTAKQEALAAIGGVAVVLAGAVLAERYGFDRALIPLLALLAGAAFVPVSELTLAARQLADSIAATRRVQAVYAEPVTVLDGPGHLPGTAGRSAISFSDVTFSYDRTSEPVLSDVSFTVPTGSMLALVGPSGAGKTTIANLLLRFWDPDGGRIMVDGVDLRTVPIDELRNHIALVAQDTYLFNTTLAENIRLARPVATESELRQAIECAALSDLVDRLQDGFATQVGERGMQLSGGQRQRVAIARAFLKNAPLLIMDEATSHLDAESEREIQASLESLMRGRTTIVIAHRLSTVRAADLILVIDRGRVVESGTHIELMNKGGMYGRLVRRQVIRSQSVA